MKSQFFLVNRHFPYSFLWDWFLSKKEYRAPRCFSEPPPLEAQMCLEAMCSPTAMVWGFHSHGGSQKWLVYLFYFMDIKSFKHYLKWMIWRNHYFRTPPVRIDPDLIRTYSRFCLGNDILNIDGPETCSPTTSSERKPARKRNSQKNCAKIETRVFCGTRGVISTFLTQVSLKNVSWKHMFWSCLQPPVPKTCD